MMQKLMEINDHLVRTLAECEQLRNDQKTLREISSVRLQRITELQDELRKACAERDEAVEHAARLHAELDATRKQLQDVCSAKPAGQSDLVRDVSHYIEAAEVDRPTESQPQPQQEPVQIREGRWETRDGKIRNVTPTPEDHDVDLYPWWDAQHRQTWRANGQHHYSGESTLDLVKYLGPIEPEEQPEPQFKPYTFAAYVVGDKSHPDALRIVWATEEWIQHSQFGIVHRMKDMQFFGNDGGCNITEYHETLTLSLKIQ